MCGYLHMCAGTWRKPEEDIKSSELEIQRVVSCLTRIRGPLQGQGLLLITELSLQLPLLLVLLHVFILCVGEWGVVHVRAHT